MSRLWSLVSILPLVSSVSMGSVTAPSFNNSNVLYWQDKNDVYRATCLADKPITRENCTTNQSKYSVEVVTKRATDFVQRGMDSTSLAIAAELKQLRDSEPTVQFLNQQIAALSKQKTILQTSIDQISAQIKVDTASRKNIEEQLAFDDQQIKAIEKQLRVTPRDADLLALRAQLVDEVKIYTAKGIEVTTRLQSSQKRLTTYQSMVTGVDADLKARQVELKKYTDELDVTSPRLEQLKSELSEIQGRKAGVTEILAMLAKQDVIYRSTLFSKQLQAAFQLLERAFGAAILTPGRYKPATAASLCPQKVDILDESQVKLTYLAPCNGQTSTLACAFDGACNVVGGPFASITIKDDTHYEFANGSSKTLFVYEAPAFQ